MLHVRHPTLFELDKVLEANNSQKRRQPVCIMMKSQRFPQIIRQKGNLAPGQYKMDCTLPLNKQSEVLASRLTRARSAPKIIFSKEKRVDKEDCLLGLSPYFMKDPNELGPGQYKLMKLGIGSKSMIRANSPSYSI